MEDYEPHICDIEIRQKRNFFFEDSHAFSSGATAFFISTFWIEWSQKCRLHSEVVFVFQYFTK